MLLNIGLIIAIVFGFSVVVGVIASLSERFIKDVPARILWGYNFVNDCWEVKIKE